MTRRIAISISASVESVRETRVILHPRQACPFKRRVCIPWVVLAKNLAHDLHPYKVAEQWVDGGHLEEQARPCNEHPDVATGEIVQEVLRGGRGRDRLDGDFRSPHQSGEQVEMGHPYRLDALLRQRRGREDSEDQNPHI